MAPIFHEHCKLTLMLNKCQVAVILLKKGQEYTWYYSDCYYKGGTGYALYRYF